MANVAYVMAEGGYESIHMEEPEEGIAKADYDYSEIHEYSDISQTSIDATLSAEFKLSKSASLYGYANYIDFQDDEPWVYGDQTGSLFTGALGAKFHF